MALRPELETRCRFHTFLISLILFLCPAFAARGETIHVSYAGQSGFNVPVWFTKEAGLFKKHGIDTDLILISGGAPNIQALLAGQLQFVNAAGTLPVLASLQGADVVILATSYNLMPFSFVVNENVRSPADLKGKTVSVARLGGINEVAVRLALEALGLSANDMTLLQGGPDAQRIMGLKSGQVAATVFAPPALFVATSLGLKVMADPSSLGMKYPASVIVARRSYIAQNKSLTKRFLMAFMEGLSGYKKRRDLAIRVTEKYSNIRQQDQLAKTYEYYARYTLSIPFSDAASVYNGAPEIRARGRKAEEFFDNTLIQEIIDDGFMAGK